MNRWLLIIVVAAFAALGLAQTDKSEWRWVKNYPHSKLVIRADNANQTGSVEHVAGGVQIKSETMTLWADQVEWNTKTGEATAQGHIRLKMLDPPAPK